MPHVQFRTILKIPDIAIKMNTIRLLSENRFRSFIRWLSGGEDGGDDEAGKEATGIITLHHPDDAIAKTFYAKFYPDLQGRSRAMVNEVAGYILARRYDLPQPPKACIVRLPLKKLDLKSLPKKHGWLKETAKVIGTYPAFCTEALNVPTPWHHYGQTAIDAMKADIRRWPGHMKTVVFDDVIANLDRHLNNLLRTGASRYALIDHGRLVVASGHWAAKDLDAHGVYENRLLSLLYDDPSIVANDMIAAAENVGALLAGMEEVNNWTNVLIRNPEESNAFDKFLRARTIEAPERIAGRHALC